MYSTALGKPTFTIREDQLELGIGIHGEPGAEESKMMKSSEIAEYLAQETSPLTPNYQLEAQVAVVVRGMGGTSNMEKFIFYKDVHAQLAALGVKVRNSFIGEYTPSMEMMGLQLTVL